MSKSTSVTTSTFEQEVLKSPIPVLVDFWAEWCAPCLLVSPHVDAIAEELDGRVKVVNVDVDSEQALAIRYGVMSIPSLFIFKDGRVVQQLIGLRPKQAIKEALERYL
jgi:thioredoxin 1